MMTPSVRRMYQSALKDSEYLKEVKEASVNNKIPSWYSDEIDKTIFATVYYGWLIGKGRMVGELKQYFTELDGM